MLFLASISVSKEEKTKQEKKKSLSLDTFFPPPPPPELICQETHFPPLRGDTFWAGKWVNGHADLKGGKTGRHSTLFYSTIHLERIEI